MFRFQMNGSWFVIVVVVVENVILFRSTTMLLACYGVGIPSKRYKNVIAPSAMNKSVLNCIGTSR
ncbi:MAG: hypothetical protein GXO35_02540 [Gammaproteobacteria bacterium]|nr:hypothetical protein [Gammaproteobacteria bacterium]